MDRAGPATCDEPEAGRPSIASEAAARDGRLMTRGVGEVCREDDVDEIGDVGSA